MKHWIILLLFSISLHSSAQETAYYANLEASGGVQESRFDHLQKAGFRLLVNKDSVAVLINNVYHFSQAMGRGKGAVEIVYPGGRLSLKAKDLRNMFRDQYLGRYKNKSKKYLTSRSAYFNRLWKGKHRKLKYTYAFVLGVPVTCEKPLDWHIAFQDKGKTFATLTFGESLVRRMNQTLWVEENECTPFNRWTHFLSGTSMGPRSVTKPFYSPVQVNRSSKTFAVTFERNSAAYSPGDLQEMLDYLENQQKGIARIHIQGYASVEGDSVANARLHDQRAEVLVKALSKYGEEEVRYVVKTEENWDLFDAQIKQNRLPAFSREEWKKQLSDDSVRSALEPLLAQQRTASVTLHLYDRKPWGEIYQSVKDEFDQAYGHYSRSASRKSGSKTSLGRLLAMRDYIRDKVEKGIYPVDSLFSFTGTEWDDYNLYVLFDEVTRKDTLLEQRKVLSHVLRKAYATALYRFETFSSNKIVQSDLLYVQQTAFSYIEEGYFKPEMLNAFPVPQEDKYLNLYINYLGFMERLEKEGMLSVTSEERRVVDRTIKDTRYYFLLKRIATDMLDNKLRALAYRSDWMLEFDLAEFLSYSIHFWEPFENTLLDEEVTIKKMDKLLQKLRYERKRLCKDDMVFLELAFYRRVVQEASLREVGEPLITRALTYLDKYYRRNAHHFTREQRVELANQLVAANSYCFYNEALELAIFLKNGEGDLIL